VRRVRGVGRGVWGLALSLSLLTASRAPTQSPAPDAPRSTPSAADSILETRTREVASQLRCPVCQGESIEQSPSELAQELKSVVREQLAAGRTPDEVRQYFVGRYGEWILLKPETTGFNRVVYVVPPLLLLLGAGLVVLLVRKWTRAPAGPPAPAGGPAAELIDPEPR